MALNFINSIPDLIKDIDCQQETRQNSVKIEHTWCINDINELVQTKSPGEKIESKQFSFVKSSKNDEEKNDNDDDNDNEVDVNNNNIVYQTPCIHSDYGINYFLVNSFYRIEMEHCLKETDLIAVKIVLHPPQPFSNSDDKLKSRYNELIVRIKCILFNGHMDEIFDKKTIERRIDFKNGSLLDISTKFCSVIDLIKWLSSRQMNDFCLITHFQIFTEETLPNDDNNNTKSFKMIHQFKHSWKIRKWRNFLLTNSTQISKNSIFVKENEIDDIVDKLTNSSSLLKLKFDKFKSKLFHLHSYEIESNVFNNKQTKSKKLTRSKINQLLKQVKWKLQLYPRGYSQQFDNQMSLFLNFNQLSGSLEKFIPNSNVKSTNCEDLYDNHDNMGFNLLIAPSDVDDTNKETSSTNEVFVKASFQISILDSSGNRIDKCQSDKQLFELFGSWGYKEYIPNDSELSKYYQTHFNNNNNGKLILNCKIILYYTLTTKKADYKNDYPLTNIPNTVPPLNNNLMKKSKKF
jgi:hypothetical protein